jgi:hypothetical protein
MEKRRNLEMAYRTYINGHEWLGNNVMYDEVYEELKRQGCPFDEEDIVDIDTPFEVKDLDGLVKATEKAIKNLYNKEMLRHQNIADFSEHFKYGIGDLTWMMMEVQEYGYIFLSAMLLRYVGECHKQWDFEFVKGGIKYKLINDGKCLFAAF